MALQPLRKDDLKIGKPVPYSIYDKDRVLLLGHGCVIESDTVLESLREQGMFSCEEKPQGNGRLFKPSIHSDRAAANQPAERRGPALDELPVATTTSMIGEEAVVSFLDTNLRIGDALQMRFDDGTAERYPVRLIGALDKRSLLVTHPQVDGRMAFLKDGQVLKLKALRGKQAYSFEAAVLKCQLAPYPYLHLTYPQQVRSTAIRKAHRIPLSAVASIGRSGERGRVVCNMRDISVAGMLANLPREVAVVGMAVEAAFRLQIDGQPVTFDLPGVVRNVREAEPGATYRTCGIEFDELAREQRHALQLFIYETMLNET